LIGYINDNSATDAQQFRYKNDDDDNNLVHSSPEPYFKGFWSLSAALALGIKLI